MRSPRSWIGPSVLLLAIPALSPAAERSIRPGQYELTTEMKLEGIDRDLPASTTKHCYTADDVKDLKKMAQDPQGRNRDCEVSDMKENGKHVSWSTTCKSGAKGTGEITYGVDAWELTMNMENPGGPHGSMKMKIHTMSKRIGDCAR